MAHIEKPKALQTSVKRQLIVSIVALGIVAGGGWSLLGQDAPYHPEGFGDVVTQNASEGLVVASD
ncbi:MAG: hypothetical protein WBG95_09365 [Sulfitobacter sp.]